MKRKLFGFADIIIIAAFLLFALGMLTFWIFGTDLGGKVVITKDNKVVKTLNINEDIQTKIATEEAYNTVIIKDKKCYIQSSDCRDKICVNRGKISKKGESIVCLPHRLIVEIK